MFKPVGRIFAPDKVYSRLSLFKRDEHDISSLISHHQDISFSHFGRMDASSRMIFNASSFAIS